MNAPCSGRDLHAAHPAQGRGGGDERLLHGVGRRAVGDGVVVHVLGHEDRLRLGSIGHAPQPIDASSAGDAQSGSFMPSWVASKPSDS